MVSDVFYRSTLKVSCVFLGYYRYKDVFQILESDKSGPTPDHKYVDIEFNDKYMMNKEWEFKNVFGQAYGHLDLLQELIALLHICTNQSCELDTDGMGAKPLPQKIIQGFTPVEKELHSSPMEKSDTRILERMNPGLAFIEIQSQSELLLDNYFRLDDLSRSRINSSLFLQNKMRQIILISASMGVVGYISSIENLVDFEGERNGFESKKCESCKQPVYSITRRFNDFMNKYSEENFKVQNDVKGVYRTQQEFDGLSFKKLIGEFYKKRSSITHAGDILRIDKMLSSFSMKDVRFFNEVETHARIALFSYILNFDFKIDG
ncbi:hypothetical protein [Pectobacterium versatile]|uniref:hypothetical protein n=1 Tax=Pectobacterium versatile TaxID=2488639 RepID=UPI001BB2E3DF|nr:hypothetical protein [Pectobacterium versatile]